MTLVHSGGLYQRENPVIVSRKDVQTAPSHTPRSNPVKRAFLVRALEMDVYPTGGCTAGWGSFFMNPYGTIRPRIMSKKSVDIREMDYRLASARAECSGCWTPCERYQSLAFNIPAIIRGLHKS